MSLRDHMIFVGTLLTNVTADETGKNDTYTVTIEITSFITPPQQPLTTPVTRLRAQSGLSPSEGKSISVDLPNLSNEISTEFPSTDEVFEDRYSEWSYHCNGLLTI